MECIDEKREGIATEHAAGHGGAATDLGGAATEHVSPEPETNASSTSEQTLLPIINSLDDVIASFGPQRSEEEACRTLRLAAQTLKDAKQDQIRKLCKPWGVTGQQTTESMYRRQKRLIPFYCFVACAFFRIDLSPFLSNISQNIISGPDSSYSRGKIVVRSLGL